MNARIIIVTGHPGRAEEEANYIFGNLGQRIRTKADNRGRELLLWPEINHAVRRQPIPHEPTHILARADEVVSTAFHTIMVVATYSELFITRIRRRVAEGVWPGAAVVIHYVSPNHHEPIIRLASLENNGELPESIREPLFEEDTLERKAYLDAAFPRHSGYDVNLPY